MPDRPQNEVPESISEAAADWLVLIRAGEMSDQEKLDYIHWLKQSPDHVREILELVSLEQMLRETHAGGLVQPVDPETLVDGPKVIELPSNKQQEEDDLEVPAEK